MRTNLDCKKALTRLIYEKFLLFIFTPVYDFKFNVKFCSLKVRLAFMDATPLRYNLILVCKR